MNFQERNAIISSSPRLLRNAPKARGGRNAIEFTGNTKNIGEATHQSQETPEQEVNAAIDIALDVYLYAIGTNIIELEMNETTRVQA